MPGTSSDPTSRPSLSEPSPLPSSPRPPDEPRPALATAATVDRTALEGEAGRRLRLAILDASGYREATGLPGLAAVAGRADRRLWVDLTEPSPALVGEVGRLLGIHPLIAEDIAERNQRAKVELTDEDIHVVLFALTPEGATPDVRVDEIDFVLTDDCLLTAHDATFDPRALQHLRDGAERLLAIGPARLLWAIADSVVDDYFPVMDRVADEIDALEDEVVERADPDTLRRVFALKRTLIRIRHAAAPEREMFNLLSSRELAVVDRDTSLYLRDVYDHLIRLTDELDSFRELVTGTLDVYLSTVNNNLSAIMKRLTAVTVILAGIGAVAGIFGMSEAGTAISGGESGGFWMITGLAVGLGLVAVAWFRRIDWI